MLLSPASHSYISYFIWHDLMMYVIILVGGLDHHWLITSFRMVGGNLAPLLSTEISESNTEFTYMQIYVVGRNYSPMT